MRAPWLVGFCGARGQEEAEGLEESVACGVEGVLVG